MRLRVIYGSAADFLVDYRSQIARGGLLVRVQPTDPLERGADIELEVVTPVGIVRLTAQVIQVLAGAGIAVTVGVASLSGLVDAAEADARSGQPRSAQAPRHEIIADGADPEAEHEPDPASPSPSTTSPARPEARTRPPDVMLAKKIQQALHGDKSQRMALLREHNKRVHGYVVRNAQIQLDEVIAIARMTTVSVDVLAYIAARREWVERPEVAAALVRNPRTPVPLAVRLLDNVHPAELRQLAKQQNVRDAVQRAARKKIIG